MGHPGGGWLKFRGRAAVVLFADAAYSCDVMKSKLTTRFLVFISAIAWCPALAFIVTNEAYFWLDRSRWAIGSIDGVVVSRDAVYIAEAHHGRVYKFDLDGNVVGWVDVHGQPIRITQEGRQVVVHYNRDERPINDPEFVVNDPGDVTATVTRSWWGHPSLEVHDSSGVRISSMQPWYLTLVQSPFPGGAWPATAIGLSLVALFQYRRTEARRQCQSELDVCM